MPDIQALIQPISEASPSGTDLKYDALFDKIRNLRKLEDTSPKGLWETEKQESDFGLIVKLITEALSKKTKDLQLAAWLTEAWIYEEGVQGLIAGLDLSRELVANFWETVYPEIEDGDAEQRASSLDWVGSYFDPSKGSSPIFALQNIAFTISGHTWLVYQESRRIGYEAEVNSVPAKKEARALAIKDGKIPPEIFDKDFEATKKDFYKKLKKDLEAATESLSILDTLCREKFGEVAPSFLPLRQTIQDLGNACQILLAKKLQKDPDPIVEDPAEVAARIESAEETPAEEAVAGVADLDLSQMESGAIKNETQAMIHVVAAAQFMRKQNPKSPASYLLLRALRWGELRGAPDVQAADLPAPQAEVRKALRTAASAGNWKNVLESAETAMSNACGRGWLDLQRYAIRASTELGYEAAAKAMRSELKTLLTDFPDLTKATLNDDTGAANPETLAWLKQEGLIA